MIRELVPFTQAEGTLPADLEPVVDLFTQGCLDRDRPDNMAPVQQPRPKEPVLIGERYVGEGAEAAHINTVPGDRSGPS